MKIISFHSPITLLTFFFLFLTSILAKPQVEGTYEHGPIEIDEKGSFYFTIDQTTNKARLAIVVNEKNTPENGPAWVGLGISEPTSGSMLGADVVTAEWSTSGKENCTLVDRYVPFFAFPLNEAVNEAQAVFPLKDDCQDDESWILKRCSRETSGFVLEVERDLKAHDTQDRDIPSGTNNIIYAYGGAFMYHGPRRRSSKVVLYKNQTGGDFDLEGGIGKAQRELPSDVDGNFTIGATNYSPPTQKITTYACTGSRIPIKKGEKKMIVAVDHFIDADEDLVHHFTVQLCKGEEYLKQIEKTRECSTADDGFSGPIGNSEARCTVFVMGWAKGMQRYVLPDEAGIVVDDETNIIILETHYDNPKSLSNVNDKSGVVIHTTSKMRENEAGSLQLGDALILLGGEKVRSNFEYEFTCPTGCTQRFSRPVNLFANFLHMHTTGQEIYLNKFSNDGQFIENVNRINFWSDSFQNYENMIPPKQLKPGEQLSLSCLYDTRKKPDTIFGIETKNEMCMSFVGYWPVQTDKNTGEELNLCTFGFDRENNETLTFCGDGGTANQSTWILPVKNPAFEDTIGASTDFGKKVDTCDSSVNDKKSDSTSEKNENGKNEGEEDEEDDDDDDDDDNVCFPSDAEVSIVSNGIRIRKQISQLAIGDEVAVNEKESSKIFLFTHKERNRKYTFAKLTTNSRTITLTRGHYLYVDGKMQRAGVVKTGMKLKTDQGKWESVISVDRVVKQGLYNPQTLKGDIIVDGIIASTFTTAIDGGNDEHFSLPHALLTPLRAAFQLFTC